MPPPKKKRDARAPSTKNDLKLEKDVDQSLKAGQQKPLIQDAAKPKSRSILAPALSGQTVKNQYRTPKVCQHCEKQGHLLRECRTRKYELRQRQITLTLSFMELTPLHNAGLGENICTTGGETVSDSMFVMKSKSTDIALLGNNVTLKCNLTIPADVLQITWQKVQGSIPENIGTYSSQYGEKILPAFKERIHCSSAELTSSSMTIYNVTLEDDACYKCLFNVFPDGIHGGQMCFSVQSVSELRIEHYPHPSNKSILIVICSATGKPAPHITFSHERLLIGLPKEQIDKNPDGIANVTKWYNISLEAMTSLKFQNVSCDLDHPLRKRKKLVSFSEEPESTFEGPPLLGGKLECEELPDMNLKVRVGTEVGVLWLLNLAVAVRVHKRS
ncbi:nectin-1-like [Dromiciops gliroides]|uniref:nectin-1-like n=1 Tax=Dromiciops gliroides TaxID=33562 RepID=UPI001CC6794D|nr:nectin-1-like [Dromiciops gliroides]